MAKELGCGSSVAQKKKKCLPELVVERSVVNVFLLSLVRSFVRLRFLSWGCGPLLARVFRARAASVSWHPVVVGWNGRLGPRDCALSCLRCTDSQKPLDCAVLLE